MTAPAEYYDNNISKTIRMLNVLVNHFNNRLPAIMFSSSAAVYGEPESWPVTEENEIQPISPYGATKAMTERILSDYFKAYSLNSMCFRYFNAAGAEPVNFDLGQEPEATHLVARALEASIAGHAVTINGSDFDTEDGTCVRDYVHVWDIARAHVSGASYLLDDYPQAGAHVYNLGTGRGTSNLQIVNYINDKYKLPFVNFGEPRKGDPATLVASAVRAKYQLHWEPLFSDTATIIDSAYNWYVRE
jgi:UDP-glucose-4-epimerase GalE